MDGSFWKTVLNNEETQHTMKITPVNRLRYYQSPKGDESEPERGDGGDSPHPTRRRGEQRRNRAGGAGDSLNLHDFSPEVQTLGGPLH